MAEKGFSEEAKCLFHTDSLVSSTAHGSISQTK